MSANNIFCMTKQNAIKIHNIKQEIAEEAGFKSWDELTEKTVNPKEMNGFRDWLSQRIRESRFKKV